MTDPPPCASHGCDQPGTNQRPRHTSRGLFYIWLCPECHQTEIDTIHERNQEWWSQ